MEIKNLHMKNLKNYIQNIRFKTFFLFYVICMINVTFANSSKHIFKKNLEIQCKKQIKRSKLLNKHLNKQLNFKNL